MKPIREYGLWRYKPVAFALRMFMGLVAAFGLTAMFSELQKFGLDDEPKTPKDV
jgi:hypothetical protein